MKYWKPCFNLVAMQIIAMWSLNIRFAQTVANTSIATPLTGAEPPWHVLPAVCIVSVHIQRQLVGSTKLRSQTKLFHVKGKPGQIPNLMGGIYWAQKVMHCNRDSKLNLLIFLSKHLKSWPWPRVWALVSFWAWFVEAQPWILDQVWDRIWVWILVLVKVRFTVKI